MSGGTVPNHMSQQGNKFTLYRGLILENKDPWSRVIKVELQELSPYTGGKVAPIEKVVTLQGGDNYSSEVKTANFVLAEYFGMDPNRAFCPDVVANEQVLVFNYGDSDKYYWVSAGIDDNLRKTERMRIQVADIQKTVKELSEENTYYMELDTLHNKRIVLQTSMSDNEDFAYTIMIDAKNSKVTISDNNNNMFLLDSNKADPAAPRLMLRNTNGSYMEINGDNGIFSVIKSLTFKAGDQIVMSSPIKTDEQTTKDKVSVSHTTGETRIADDTFVVTSPSIGLNGALKVDSIVAKTIQAESFSTGAFGMPYVPSTTDLGDGTGNMIGNSPDTGSGGVGNRHCVAWEDFMRYAAIVNGMLACCCAHCGCADNTADAIGEATSSKMPKNRGE